MPQTNRLPLSGDVTQAINPWEWMLRIAGSQMGFINIHQSTSADPQMEREIVENVASYGRQLGRLVDVMDILIEQLDRSALTEAEQAELARFEAMSDAIEQTKQRRRRGNDIFERVDELLTDLSAMQHSAPEAYEAARQKLREAVDTPEAANAHRPRVHSG